MLSQLFLCIVKLIMVLFFFKEKWFLPFCLQVAGPHFGSHVARIEMEIFAFEPQWRLIFIFTSGIAASPSFPAHCVYMRFGDFCPHGFFC